VTSSLQDILTRKGIAAALNRINPTVAGVELDSIQNPSKAFVAHRLRDKILPLELAQESDGFRRFYAHLLALYQTPPKQTLIFEEPENGIYPGALSLLAEEFKAAPQAGRGQVLLTTHSPALLDHFSVEQIRVVDLVDLETHIGPLVEEQRDAIVEELLHTGELLTVDPARTEAK
jgi:predicted ATPase